MARPVGRPALPITLGAHDADLLAWCPAVPLRVMAERLGCNYETVRLRCLAIGAPLASCGSGRQGQRNSPAHNLAVRVTRTGVPAEMLDGYGVYRRAKYSPAEARAALGLPA